MPKVYDLKISDTTSQSITLDLLMNLTNPTNYSATVPFVDVNILVNDTIMGHATAKDIEIGPGNNTAIPIRAVWEPAMQGGVNGTAVGQELLSQYISGIAFPSLPFTVFSTISLTGIHQATTPP